MPEVREVRYKWRETQVCKIISDMNRIVDVDGDITLGVWPCDVDLCTHHLFRLDYVNTSDGRADQPLARQPSFV